MDDFVGTSSENSYSRQLTPPLTHRKPENLLFSTPDRDSAEIKISDFGLAKIWSGDMLVKTACGSPNYVGIYLPPHL